LIIEYEGREYPYDPDDLDIDQALLIEKHIGGTLMDWQKGIYAYDTKCTQVLGWIVLRGGDLSVPIESVNFKVNKLRTAFEAAAEKENAAEKAKETAADPTAAANGQSPSSIPASSPSA
jgi:hypothetical protein